jgi:hypothetical protein
VVAECERQIGAAWPPDVPGFNAGVDLIRKSRRLLRRPADRTRAGALRQKLRAHNLHVLSILFLSVIGSALLWLGAYFFGYWMLLVLVTIAHGTEAQMPPQYTKVYLIVAACAFCAAWIDRRLRPDPRPADKKPPFVIALDFVFTPARMLLSLRDNASAWQSLSDADLQQAIAFIDRVRAVRRFPVHTAPVEIPDDTARERVVFALLHLRILEMIHDDGVAWLRYVDRPPPEMLGGAGPALP